VPKALLLACACVDGGPSSLPGLLSSHGSPTAWVTTTRRSHHDSGAVSRDRRRTTSGPSRAREEWVPAHAGSAEQDLDDVSRRSVAWITFWASPTT
jgi:hypothetical protein